jgi:alpha-beta hydrolase superfamily lysophospholipase
MYQASNTEYHESGIGSRYLLELMIYFIIINVMNTGKLYTAYFLIILCTIWLNGCLGTAKRDVSVFNSGKTLNEIWRVVYNLPLDLECRPEYPECIKKYFSYYQMDFEGVDHYFGSFRTGNYLIAAHIYMPRFAIETVYLLHGYLLHSGYYNEFIKLLLDHNFAVAVFDLPGHGFSSGDLANIGSFSEYARIFHDFIIKTDETFLPPPFAVVSHSTGGAAVIEYLLTYESPFSVYIFSSPLVRSQLWNLSKTGVGLFQGIIKSVPAPPFIEITSDKEYMDFLRHREPLRRQRVPVTWVKALFQWNKKLTGINKQINKKILVFQGKKDNVVDWKYNMNFIREMFPRARIVFYDNARHEIFKERPAIREQILDAIIKELERKRY